MSLLTVTPPSQQPDQNALKQEELKESGIRIRGYLVKGAELIFLAGEELSRVKDRLEHGEWLQWLADEFPLSERTAQRYISAYKRFKSEFDRLSAAPLEILEESDIPHLLVPNTSDQQKLLNNASTVVENLAPGAIKSKVMAGEIGVVKAARSITLAPPEVRECAIKWDVGDPGVIDTLAKMADKLPDEFNGVVNSGFFQWGDGRRMPLRKATDREAKECYVSLRKDEAIIEHQANTPQPLVDTSAYIHRLDPAKQEDLGYFLTFQVDEETYRKLLNVVNTEQRLIIRPLTR